MTNANMSGQSCPTQNKWEMIRESGGGIDAQSRLTGFRFAVPAASTGALAVAADGPFAVVRGPRGQ